MKSQITNALSDFFFEYETPRQVLVRNKRVGVVCRLIQLGVLAYIIGWVFIYEKGYQSTDTAVSSVFTKMKGVGYTNVSGRETVWDVADYVFPSQMEPEPCRKREEEKEEERMLSVEAGLLNIQLSDPQDPYPPSYRINSPQEIQLLAMAENFQRQYVHLYPERKPLLLFPLNECGVRKFVSTTLRPTTTGHYGLHTWQGCASFVSDILSLQPLDPPTELPSQLFSSSSVLLSQKANAFEFSSLLCSLLLGLSYDSYCVSGYAIKEKCLQDQSLQTCPLLDTEDKREQSESSDQEQKEKKYGVRKPRELRSRFLLQQEEKKKQEAEAALALKQKLQEESECQRPADPLHGLRVHCWVLVLSGRCGIQENFFIDPLTGTSFPTDSADFLGIESVWNHDNYFVNMQDCSTGCKNMVFDLEDLKLWEPLLFGATSRKKLMLDVLETKESVLDQDHVKQPRFFYMPIPWVSSISISKDWLYPTGRKVTLYRKAKLEKFSLLVNADGLLTRLTKYKDLNCSEVATVKEWYDNRSDSLEEREINQLENITSERFSVGKSLHLLFHRWKSLNSGMEREMKFSYGRLDNLVRIVLSPREMLQFFDGRMDFLYYKQVWFDDVDPSMNHSVTKVLQRFHRNPSKPANKDVAEQLFQIRQGQIELTYHLMEHHFIPSKAFIKIPKVDQDFTPDMVSIFQVDLSEKPPQCQSLLRMLKYGLDEQFKAVKIIPESINEIAAIVTRRELEDHRVKLLTPSLSATERDCQRRQWDTTITEEICQQEEQEKGILVPNKKQESPTPEEKKKIYGKKKPRAGMPGTGTRKPFR